ncbi:TonB-dependent siderophore receptor [Pseudoxanthomonas helianthi]|uniref:TonB-dependent siderophore receptor n=1 Tax=Pseudoxanthomonas helianthi TaxID=1453541 RepID=A0A940WZF5_9GAMM|nr:TonB-dependent siderophore receptor [Pseudoxanthomonas helianthi]MBP3982896.1 TonB-dependent siderophore receptor [Pseudoxanthomonas helianthi]
MSRRSAFRILIPTCLAVCTQMALAQEAAQSASATAQASTSETKAKTLDAVNVRDERKPYRNLSVTGATKTDALIKDLPQSIQILDSGLLRDAGVTDLKGALDLSSTISQQSNFGGLWDSYAMRGFAGNLDFGSDYMVNGFSASRGFNGVRDGGNTNSVEILKGPSSALYGRGEPGGTVNINTKKPLFKAANTLDLSVGTFNTYRGAIDSTGPLGETVAYRLNAAYQEGDSFRDYIHYKRYLVAPSFLWMISPDTTLSYEIEAVRQEIPFDRGVVAIDGFPPNVDIHNFYGEPNDGPHIIKSLGHQVFLQHWFNDNWQLQTGFSFRESSMEGNSSEVRPYGALRPGNILRRRYRDRDNNAVDRSARFEIIGKVATGKVTHNLLFGVDGYRFDDRRKQNAADPAGTIYGINAYDPVYGAPKPVKAISINTDEDQKSYAVYAQDQIDLGERWKALVGVRYDKYEQTVHNLRTGNFVHQEPTATSPRVGLVYQPNEHWSLYATTSSSFRPNSGASRPDSNNVQHAFDPEEGKSYEIGAKWDTGRVNTTLALYKITKNNVLTPDPIDPNNYSMAVGEVESKGVELDVSGQIAEGLRLYGSYAYTDAQVTKDNAALTGFSLTGRQMANVPKDSANVLLIKDFAVAGNKAYLGGGVQYVGEREGAQAAFSAVDFFKLKSYTTWKAVAGYDVTDKLKLTLDVNNLFNKRFYASSYSLYWVMPGSERTITLNARYAF